MEVYLELRTDPENIQYCKIRLIDDEYIQFDEGVQGFKADGKSRYVIKQDDSIDDLFVRFVGEYTDKGYIECDEPDPVVPEQYLQLINSSSLIADLKDYFSYLADSDRILPVFEAIMDTAETACFEDGLLIIGFRTATLRAWPPADPEKYSDWPESFRNLVSRHRKIEFPQSDYALIAGDISDQHHFHSGLSYVDVLENSRCDFIDKFGGEDNIKCPFIDYRNLLFYHPEVENRYGEPALFTANPVRSRTLKPHNWKIGSIYLRKAAGVIQLPDEDMKLPAIPSIRQSR